MPSFVVSRIEFLVFFLFVLFCFVLFCFVFFVSFWGPGISYAGVGQAKVS